MHRRVADHGLHPQVEQNGLLALEGVERARGADPAVLEIAVQAGGEAMSGDVAAALAADGACQAAEVGDHSSASRARPSVGPGAATCQTKASDQNQALSGSRKPGGKRSSSTPAWAIDGANSRGKGMVSVRQPAGVSQAVASRGASTAWIGAEAAGAGADCGVDARRTDWQQAPLGSASAASSEISNARTADTAT